MSGHAPALSSVHRGIAFELRCLHLLQAHLSMTLRHVGGRSDGGVDLVGWWWLPCETPSHPVHRPAALQDADGLMRRRLRILAQCKAEKKKFTPKYVREMEGVWHLRSRTLPARASAPPDVYPTVALLLSESAFSQSTVLHAYRSTVPFLLIQLPPPPSSETTADDMEIGTVCPNPALSHLVKPLAFCWERHPAAGAPTQTDASKRGRPGLWWQGRKLASWTPHVSDSDEI